MTAPADPPAVPRWEPSEMMRKLAAWADPYGDGPWDSKHIELQRGEAARMVAEFDRLRAIEAAAGAVLDTGHPTADDLKPLIVGYSCTRCGGEMRGNRRMCPRCGYTVFAPIWSSEKPEWDDRASASPSGDTEKPCVRCSSRGAPVCCCVDGPVLDTGHPTAPTADLPFVPDEMWLTAEWGVIESDGSGGWRTIENGLYVETLPAVRIRLVPEVDASASSSGDTGQEAADRGRAWCEVCGLELNDAQAQEGVCGEYHRGVRDAEAGADVGRRRYPAAASSSGDTGQPREGGHVQDGGQWGTLVRCHECDGTGLLHQLDPDELDRMRVEPEDAPEPAGVTAEARDA